MQKENTVKAAMEEVVAPRLPGLGSLDLLEGSRFGVRDLGFGVRGLKTGIWGLGFRILGLEV